MRRAAGIPGRLLARRASRRTRVRCAAPPFFQRDAIVRRADRSGQAGDRARIGLAVWIRHHRGQATLLMMNRVVITPAAHGHVSNCETLFFWRRAWQHGRKPRIHILSVYRPTIARNLARRVGRIHVQVCLAIALQSRPRRHFVQSTAWQRPAPARRSPTGRAVSTFGSASAGPGARVLAHDRWMHVGGPAQPSFLSGPRRGRHRHAAVSYLVRVCARPCNRASGTAALPRAVPTGPDLPGGVTSGATPESRSAQFRRCAQAAGSSSDVARPVR